MQRAYFLGGASPCGFETAFWREQQAAYGIYLKGGPGTGKSTLMKKIAAAFEGEPVSLYHCASDPHSLDAVVLEARGVFIADATAPHESSTPLPYISGELLDLAQGLHSDVLTAQMTEIQRLYAENQAMHALVRKGLGGIAAMEDLIADTGADALLTDKLHRFAQRLAKRLFPRKTGASGCMMQRQCSALTPAGKLTLIPKDFTLMLLQDAWYAASQMLLNDLAATAANCGLTAEITRAQTQSHRPITHLLLPELHLALIAAPHPPAELPAPTVIRMQRFYRQDALHAHRTLMRFCSKTASAVTAQTVSLLAEALRIHDELESYYITALDPEWLDQKATELAAKINAFPCKTAY